MDRWMVVKNCMPVQICNDINEAEQVYLAYDADEIRRVANDDYEMPLVLPSRQ